MKKISHIIGIDEAGRGPIAGPVAVGIFAAAKDFDFKMIPKLRDSKKLSERQREEIFGVIEGLAEKRLCRFSAVLVSSAVIDKKGITAAVSIGIEKCVRNLALDPSHAFIYLDGLLKAPAEFSQETVIKGDDKIPAISAASICAKVIRDRFMKKLAQKIPGYGLEIHKGYGTVLHYKNLKKLGFSKVHRKTFLKGFSTLEK